MAGLHSTSRSEAPSSSKKEKKSKEENKRKKGKKDKKEKSTRDKESKNRNHESQPLTEFKLFSKLPTEIRTIIWRLALGSRVVHVCHDSAFPWDSPRGVYTKTRTPVTLRTCHDSRRADLPCYPLSFGTILTKPHIRFNFDIDTLYVSDMGLHSTKVEELAKIKYMAVVDWDEKLGEAQFLPLNKGGYVNTMWDILQEVVPKMTSLTKLYNVDSRGLCDINEVAIPEGNGLLQLFRDIPEGFGGKNGVWDYDGGIYANLKWSTESIAGVKVTQALVWRPAEEFLRTGKL